MAAMADDVRDGAALLKDAAVHESCIHALLNAPTTDALMPSLELLGNMLNAEASHEETQMLCTALREGGAVERLCALLAERDEVELHVAILMVLGNLASDTVDAEAHETKERIRATNGVQAIAMDLFSPDASLVFYACGACMNCCSAVEDVLVLKETGAFAHPTPAWAAAA